MAENYDLIFGQSASSQYAWSNSDYQNGWQTVGSTPPTAEQFDALQRRSDTKAKDLNNRLSPLETTASKALARVTPAANMLPYFNSSNSATTTAISNFIKTLLDDGDAATARATLGAPSTTGANASGNWNINAATATTANTATNATHASSADSATLNKAGYPLEAIVAKSLDTNGYIKYASGLIIQWGETTCNGQYETFPIAFSSTKRCVVATTDPFGSNEFGAVVMEISGYRNDRFGFGLYCYNVKTSTLDKTKVARWIAIGY